jgi:hypothetical protein
MQMAMSQGPTVRAGQRPPRRPAPGWPFWLAFGVLLPLGLIGLVIWTSIASAGAHVVEDQHRLLGRSALVSGTFLEAENVSALPETNSFYTAVLPDDAPGALAGSVQRLGGPMNVGFPPSREFPQSQDFLVTYDGDEVVVEKFGNPGRVGVVTESSVRSAESTAAVYTGLLIFGWIWLVLVATVLPTLAIAFSVRRRRAGRPGLPFS